MPPVKAAWCCQHVCGFRYADDMLPAGSIGSMRVLVVEGKHSAHRAAPPSCRRSTPQPRPGTGALDAAQLADDVDRGDPAKTRQLEVLVAQLVLVGMCAMLRWARCSSSGSSTWPVPGGHPPWWTGREAGADLRHPSHDRLGTQEPGG